MEENVMKKIVLILVFVTFGISSLYSQNDCSGITCPSGWTLEQTGWVIMQVGEDSNGPIYCVVNVCYCYQAPDTYNSDYVNFEIKKVNFLDSSCMDLLNPTIFKEKFLEKAISTHLNELPPIPCPDIHWSGTIWTATCYIQTSLFTIVPCQGSGQCEQGFLYCIDYTVNPPLVKIVNMGAPWGYGDCYMPEPIDSNTYIGTCIPWCGE